MGALWLAVAVLAAAPGTAEEPSDRIAVAGAVLSPDLGREVRTYLREERAVASRSLWAWSGLALAAGTYAGLALAGRGTDSGTLEAMAYLGTVVGVANATRALVRGHDLAGLEASLEAAGTVTEGGPSLTPELRAALDRELTVRYRGLKGAARGALRAGCVLPVLLGGIGGYGLATRGSGGDELAGVGLGGAVVIGVPSVLTYVGLRGRLARLEGLIAKWEAAMGREAIR